MNRPVTIEVRVRLKVYARDAAEAAAAADERIVSGIKRVVPTYNEIEVKVWEDP